MSDSLLFRSGTLDLPLTPVQIASGQVSWADSTVNSILVVAAVLLLLASMKAFLQVLPLVLDSFRRARGCLNIEHSFNLARMRNISAVACLLPFCLIADRFQFLQTLFGWDLPAWAGALAVLSVVTAFFLVRSAMYFIRRPIEMDSDTSAALHRTLYSYFILLCIVMLASTSVFLIFDVPDGLCRNIFFAEIIFFYLFSLVRTTYFLLSCCGGFATILYLCALEIVPAAAVAVTCTFLRL